MDKDQSSTRQLFQELERRLPSDFPQGSWYIIVASCLISIGRGDVYGNLFNYLLQKPGADHKRLSAKLREVIIKSWTLVGMPKAISASYALQAADPDGDAFDEHHRTTTTSNIDTMRAISQSWFRQVFGPKEDAIFSGFKGHRDMEWALRHTVYGIYLGDLTHLSVVQNEFLVATCVVTTGGPRSPSVSHLNALLRVGVTRAHIEVFEHICHSLFKWAGLDTSRMVRVRDISPPSE